MAWTKDGEVIGLKMIWWASVIAGAALFFVADNRAQVGLALSCGCIGGAIGAVLERLP